VQKPQLICQIMVLEDYIFTVHVVLERCWRCCTAPILCNIKIWHWRVRQRLLGCNICALVIHFSSKHCWECDADDWMDN